MKKQNKILLIFIISLLVGGITFFSTNSTLFQGKLSRISNISKEAKSTLSKVCLDSDGGKNYQEAGGVTLYNYPDGAVTKSDRCWNDSKRLQEYVCKNNKYQGDHTFDCSTLGANYICEGGACIERPCDNEIDIVEDLNQEFTIDYCTHLRNTNNMNIYFAYDDGNLILYSVREFEGQNYLLDFKTLVQAELPNIYVPYNIYSNGERIEVTAFNESEVVFGLRDNCLENYPYCNAISENVSDFYFIENDDFEYYYDSSLFFSNDVKNNYIDKAKTVNEESINFLRDSLGIFPPIDTLVQFDIYAPDESGIAYSSGFGIVNRRTDQITNEDIGFLQYGNTHEFVHVFFSGTPVIRNWFEEGLADYMEHAQQENTSLFCRNDGWEEGYYDFEGNFISNSPLVPYSDFTVYPENTVEFYDSLNSPSYYSSAECLWAYVEENYGSEAIRDVAQAWHNTRTVLPPEDLKWLVRDIINPTLGVSLSDLIYERYGYVEE